MSVSQSVSQSVSTADPWRDKETMRLVYQVWGRRRRRKRRSRWLWKSEQTREKNGVRRKERQRERERERDDEPVLRVRFDFYSSHNILRMFECYLDYREEESLKNYSPWLGGAAFFTTIIAPDTVQRCANASGILHSRRSISFAFSSCLSSFPHCFVRRDL